MNDVMQAIANAQTTLSAKELTRYLGCRVQVFFVEHPKDGKVGTLQYVRDKIDGNPMTPSVGVLLENDSFPRALQPQHIRPILRRLPSLTEQEAKHCFRLGYPYWDQREVVRVNRTETWVELFSGPLKLSISSQGVVTSERYMDDLPTPARVNALRILTYLDSLLIDTNGYIEQGLAVTSDQ